MNDALKEALRTFGRVGARAAARAVAEVASSVADDAEDLVELGAKVAEDFLGDVRRRARAVKDKLPTEHQMRKDMRERKK